MIFVWPRLPSLLVKVMSHVTYAPIPWGPYGDLPVVMSAVTAGHGTVTSNVATRSPWCLYGDLPVVMSAVTAGHGTVTSNVATPLPWCQGFKVLLVSTSLSSKLPARL